MAYIILTNGTRLDHIGAAGASRYIQGATRDTITFEFDDTYSVDELRSLFTESNCETINIVTEKEVADDENGAHIETTDNIHEGYVIRTEIGEKIKQITSATGTAAAVTETRVYVTMAQRTYEETKLAKMESKNKLLEDCIIELSTEVYAANNE